MNFTLEIQAPTGNATEIEEVVEKFTSASERGKYTRTEVEIEPIHKSESEWIPQFTDLMQWVGWLKDSLELWLAIKAIAARAQKQNPGSDPFIVRIKCSKDEKELCINIEDADVIKSSVDSFMLMCKQEENEE